MRIGAPEVAVSMGPWLLRLRPSLRCACRLHDRHGGFEPLARAIVDGAVHVMADVIAEGAPGQFDSTAAIEAALLDNLDQLDAIIPQLFAFLFALCGLDSDAPATPADPVSSTANLMSLPDFYKRLFRIATGWLGWPPETAWNATPSEILEAYTGRTELLGAIFGGPQKDNPDTSTPNINDELDSEGLQALKAMGGF